MKDCLSRSDCRQWERKAASDLPWLLLSIGKKWVSSCRHPTFQDLLWPLLCAYSLQQLMSDSSLTRWRGTESTGQVLFMRGVSEMFLEEIDLWVSRVAREDVCTWAEQSQTELVHQSPPPSPPTTELWHHPSAAFRHQNSGSWGFRLCLGILPGTPWCWVFHAWSSPHYQLFCITSLQFFIGLLSSIITWANSSDKSHFTYHFVTSVYLKNPRLKSMETPKSNLKKLRTFED